ncbi:hypothetical protein WN51_11201 [Melipona quadrifasciata]|uniref:Uncharacterized protein n=1 Tax=Melipona quadrifasciata TaxID=166423 RepID=A0A0M9A415_9HYME|nr:hypothetical protein WN51_11201 [Melipona quadrifasciata]
MYLCFYHTNIVLALKDFQSISNKRHFSITPGLEFFSFDWTIDSNDIHTHIIHIAKNASYFHRELLQNGFSLIIESYNVFLFLEKQRKDRTGRVQHWRLVSPEYTPVLRCHQFNDTSSSLVQAATKILTCDSYMCKFYLIQNKMLNVNTDLFLLTDFTVQHNVRNFIVSKQFFMTEYLIVQTSARSDHSQPYIRSIHPSSIQSDREEECQKAAEIPVGYGSLSEARDPAVRAAPHLSMAATVNEKNLLDNKGVVDLVLNPVQDLIPKDIKIRLFFVDRREDGRENLFDEIKIEASVVECFQPRTRNHPKCKRDTRPNFAEQKQTKSAFEAAHFRIPQDNETKKYNKTAMASSLCLTYYWPLLLILMQIEDY